ncbi:MAG: class F sortase [Marmoricola sp.]
MAAHGRRRWPVALLAVLGAMLLPWIVAVLAAPRVPSLELAMSGRTSTIEVGSADDDAALASMFLAPSAGTARSAPTADPQPRAVGIPRRVVVPTLGVDARVVPISGATGTLLPPSDARTIGWWREGRMPGAAVGSAVLTGHTVHTGGGAFDQLGRLRSRATVLVRTDRGWIRYAVTSSATYDKARLARDAATLFARSGPGRLVLVTCSRFDGHEYLANTVVTAEPLSG